MRNIYIAKAQFEIEDGKLHDRFYVRNRHGQKLTDPTDQQHLRLTAVLIKQFTHALTWAPDPAKALEAFDQFLDLTVQDTKTKPRRQRWHFSAIRKPSLFSPGCSGPATSSGRTFLDASTAICCRCCKIIATPR